MEQGTKRRGRPPKQQPIAGGKSTKYPLNPDPNMNFIRSIVSLTLMEDSKPFVDLGDINTQYAHRYGACRNALRMIAEELGVQI